MGQFGRRMCGGITWYEWLDMARKKKQETGSPEIEAAELRLVQIRDALAQAMKERADATGDLRDEAQARVASLQEDEASVTHEIQALKLAETKVKEEEQREKRDKKKKLAARRREAEQVSGDYGEAWSSDEHSHVSTGGDSQWDGDEWDDDDDAYERHLQEAEDREREEREHNQAQFDRALAVEKHEKELARRKAEERRQKKKAAREAEKQRALREEKQRKAKARQEEALKKSEAQRALKQASKAKQQSGDGEPSLSVVERIKRQVIQFWRELVGKD